MNAVNHIAHAWMPIHAFDQTPCRTWRYHVVGNPLNAQLGTSEQRPIAPGLYTESECHSNLLPSRTAAIAALLIQKQFSVEKNITSCSSNVQANIIAIKSPVKKDVYIGRQ